MKNCSSEKEYLKNYNIHDFDVPLASVDLCIFSIVNQSLKVLVVKRNDYPYIERWALPGGFVDISGDETLEDTAIRKLSEKTGVKTPYVEQIETIGNRNRDPRGWSMTVLYNALISHSEVDAKERDDENVRWVTLEDAGNLNMAFDHHSLLEKATKRLRSKVSYTTLPMHILPKEFTLAELQTAYEIIMGHKVEKKSFRRRIDAANILVDAGKEKKGGGRPAKLFTIKEQSDTYFYNRTI